MLRSFKGTVILKLVMWHSKIKNVTLTSVMVPLLACGPKSGDTEPTAGTGATTADETTTTGGTTTGPTSTTTTGSSTDEPTTSSGPTTTEDPPTTTMTTEPTTSPFVVESDAPKPMNACDIHLEGCEEGEKCNVFSPEEWGPGFDSLGCFPLAPEPKQIGEPCSTGELPYDGIDDCVEAAVCWEVDEEGNGTCLELCYPKSGTDDWLCHDKPANCQLCQSCVVGLCTPYCDPILNDCPGGQSCYAVNDSYTCAPVAGDGVDGSPCPYINSCTEGFGCVEATELQDCEADACCTPFCDLESPDSCPAELESCTPVFDPQPEGHEHVGLCRVPA